MKQRCPALNPLISWKMSQDLQKKVKYSRDSQQKKYILFHKPPDRRSPVHTKKSACPVPGPPLGWSCVFCKKTEKFVLRTVPTIKCKP
ncbi:hypothetical protein NQ315_011532 [Exocentrus adspersus]|uniref:Uncharacterized protein n=1 Tax=Exocentrus adspersus TaxID=1586481 RepID=A0AAV8VVA2_9CUCU|nr:hypothetical protein NQ315_011532 [Exocentrus adspersus]